MFVDPGAKELIDRLTARVAYLEQQVQALVGHLGTDAGPASGFDPAAGPADEMLALLRDGKTAQAINLHRANTGAGLAEAKDHVDQLKAQLGL